MMGELNRSFALVAELLLRACRQAGSGERFGMSEADADIVFMAFSSWLDAWGKHDEEEMFDFLRSNSEE